MFDKVISALSSYAERVLYEKPHDEAPGSSANSAADQLRVPVKHGDGSEHAKAFIQQSDRHRFLDILSGKSDYHTAEAPSDLRKLVTSDSGTYAMGGGTGLKEGGKDGGKDGKEGKEGKEGAPETPSAMFANVGHITPWQPSKSTSGQAHGADTDARLRPQSGEFLV